MCYVWDMQGSEKQDQLFAAGFCSAGLVCGQPLVSLLYSGGSRIVVAPVADQVCVTACAAFSAVSSGIL